MQWDNTPWLWAFCYGNIGTRCCVGGECLCQRSWNVLRRLYSSTIPQKKGRLLHEQARRRAVGLRAPSRLPPGPLTLGQTIRWARRILRASRLAQGFPDIAEFARHVRQLRAERAELRAWQPDPLRRDILDRLDRVIQGRPDLIREARLVAGFWWKPRLTVWWRVGKPRQYDSVRMVGSRYFPKTDVAVPAAWLVARFDEEAIA
jgi:hypothetical protein